MNKTSFEIQSLLNLKTNESIGQELADRQMEVIKRSYEFLRQPANNIIYIADEVGLGKTYIGIGIALLLRHQSAVFSNHKDLIIVPKKNLQEKWKREMRNFVDRNYLPEDTIKQALGNHIRVYDQLTGIDHEPWVSIVRATSFSHLAKPKERKSELRDHLMNNIFPSDEFSKDIIWDAWERGYFIKENDSLLRRLVACLLNISAPPIQCLIVDEAHNYKHGEGTAVRNIVTSRFLGAIKDQEILQAFPQLAGKMKFPLAQKIVCLSATPKDRELFEIRNQFDCFTDQHILTQLKSVAEIKGSLPKFLIRGNLNYQIEGQTISRNQCRVEHRKGNINKSEQAKPLMLEDNFESLFWQLLQYKSLKYLSAKNNTRFEMGMLAGFESYKLDVERKAIGEEALSGEYDLIPDKVPNRSGDHEVIDRLIEAYKTEFEGRLPPHPKQTRMEKEISRQLEEADKSLIFVRRVASAHELQTRLIERYEREVVYEKQLMLLPRQIREQEEVDTLINNYRDRKLHEKLPELYRKLTERPDIKSYFRSLNILDPEEQLDRLKYAFFLKGEFSKLAKDFIVRNNINVSMQLKQAALNDLTASAPAYGSPSNSDEDSLEENREVDEENAGEYFFASYFREKQPGYVYREKAYRENWFDIDLLAFNRRIPFLAFEENELTRLLDEQDQIVTKKKHQAFQLRQEIIRSFLSTYGRLEIGDGRRNEKTTFLTQLLTIECHDLMQLWLQKRLDKSVPAILTDLSALGFILKNIFRNGSGRLAGFIANASGKDFGEIINTLLLPPDAPFRLVYREVRTIIEEFDLLMSVNFDGNEEKAIKNVLQTATSPIVVTTGQDDINRGTLAAQFRMPGFPYVLVTTDIFREGEDLHTYCQNVYHYGIAWNPSDMEQRTGRIDRINSLSYRKLNREDKLHFDNKVQVFYPYMPQSVEINQVIRLLKNTDTFTKTFNNIEERNAYESKVPIDETVDASAIPKQIIEFLTSKYDIWGFNGWTIPQTE